MANFTDLIWRRPPQGPWRMAFLVGFPVSAVTVGALPMYLVGASAPHIRADMDFEVGGLGVLVTVFFATAALSSTAMGRLVSVWGAPRSLSISIGINVVVLVALATVIDRWIGIAAVMVTSGLSVALAHPAANAILKTMVSPRRQGFAIGLKQSAVPIGTLGAGLLVASMLPFVGWRGLMLIAAALCLGGTAFLYSAMRAASGGTPTANAQEAPIAQEAASPAASVRERFSATWRLWLLAIAFGLGNAAANSGASFAVENGVAGGLSTRTAATALAVASLGAALGRVLLGNYAGMRGIGGAGIASRIMVVGALGFGALAVGVPPLLLVGILVGVGVGWSWTGLVNYEAVWANPQAPARATAFIQAGGYTGAAIGPLTTGFVLQFGSPVLAWGLCAVLLLLGAVAMRGGAHGLEQPAAG